MSESDIPTGNPRRDTDMSHMHGSNPLDNFDPNNNADLSDLQAKLHGLQHPESPANAPGLPNLWHEAHSAGLVAHHVYDNLAHDGNDAPDVFVRKQNQQNDILESIRQSTNPSTGQNDAAYNQAQDLNARYDATQNYHNNVFKRYAPTNVTAKPTLIGDLPYLSVSGGRGEDAWNHLLSVQPTPSGGGAVYLNGLRTPSPMGFRSDTGQISYANQPGSLAEQIDTFKNLFAGGRNPFPTVQENARRVQSATDDSGDMNRAIYNNPRTLHGPGGQADIGTVGTIPRNVHIDPNYDGKQVLDLFKEPDPSDWQRGLMKQGVRYVGNPAQLFGGDVYQRTSGAHVHSVEALGNIPGWWQDTKGNIHTGGKEDDPGSALKVSRLNMRDYAHLGPAAGQDSSSFTIGNIVTSSRSGLQETGYAMNIAVIMGGGVLPEGMGLMKPQTLWDRSNKFFDLPESGINDETRAQLDALKGKRLGQGQTIDINGQSRDITGNWGGATINDWGVEGNKLWIDRIQDTAPISLKYGGLKAHMGFMEDLSDYGDNLDAVFGKISDFNQFTSSVVNAMSPEEHGGWIDRYVKENNVPENVAQALRGPNMRHGGEVTPALIDMMKRTYIPANLRTQTVSQIVDQNTLDMLRGGEHNTLASEPVSIGGGRFVAQINQTVLHARALMNAVPELGSRNATLNAQSLTGFAQSLADQPGAGEQLLSIGATARDQHMQITNAAFLNAGIKDVKKVGVSYDLGQVTPEQAQSFLDQSMTAQPNMNEADLAKHQLGLIRGMAGENMLELNGVHLAGAGAMLAQSVADDEGMEAKGAVRDYLGAIKQHMVGVTHRAAGSEVVGVDEAFAQAAKSQQALVETAGFQGAVRTPRSRSVHNAAYISDPMLPPGSVVMHDKDLEDLMYHRAQENGDEVSRTDIQQMIAGAGDRPLFSGPTTRFPNADTGRQSIISDFYTAKQYADMGGKLKVQQGQSIHDIFTVMAGGGDDDGDRSALAMLGRFIKGGIQSVLPTSMKQIVKAAQTHAAGEYYKQKAAWLGERGWDEASINSYVQQGKRFQGATFSPSQIAGEGSQGNLQAGSEMGKTYNMGRLLMAHMGVDDAAFTGPNAKQYQEASGFISAMYQNPLDKNATSEGVQDMFKLMRTSLVTGNYDTKNKIDGMTGPGMYNDISSNIEAFGNAEIHAMVRATETSPETAAQMLSPTHMSAEGTAAIAEHIRMARENDDTSSAIPGIQSIIRSESQGKSLPYTDAPANFLLNETAATTAKRVDKRTGLHHIEQIKGAPGTIEFVQGLAVQGQAQRGLKNLLSRRTGMSLHDYAHALKSTGIATKDSALWNRIRGGLGIQPVTETAQQSLSSYYGNEALKTQAPMKTSAEAKANAPLGDDADGTPITGPMVKETAGNGPTGESTGQSYSGNPDEIDGPYKAEWDGYKNDNYGTPLPPGGGKGPPSSGGGSFPVGGTSGDDPLWVRMMAQPMNQNTYDLFQKSWGAITQSSMERYENIMARGGPSGKAEAKWFLSMDKHIKRVDSAIGKNEAKYRAGEATNDFERDVLSNSETARNLNVPDSVAASNASPQIMAQAHEFASMSGGDKFDKLTVGDSGGNKTLAVASRLGDVFDSLSKIMEKTAASGGKLTEAHAKQIESYEKLASSVNKIVDAATKDAAAEPGGNGAKFLEKFNILGYGRELENVNAALGSGMGAQAAVQKAFGDFSIDHQTLNFGEKFAPWMQRGLAGQNARDAMRDSGAYGAEGSLERGMWEVGGRALALPAQMMNARYQIRGIQQEFLSPMMQARDSYLQYQQGVAQSFSQLDVFGGSNYVGSQAYQSAFRPVVAAQQRQINYGREVDRAYGGLQTALEGVFGTNIAANAQGLGSSIAAGVGVGAIMGAGAPGMIAGAAVAGIGYVGGQMIDAATNRSRQLSLLSYKPEDRWGKDFFGTLSDTLTTTLDSLSGTLTTTLNPAASVSLPQSYKETVESGNQINQLATPGKMNSKVYKALLNQMKDHPEQMQVLASRFVEENQDILSGLTPQNQMIAAGRTLNILTDSIGDPGSSAYEASRKSLAIESKSIALGINLPGVGGLAATMGAMSNYSLANTRSPQFDRYRSLIDRNILSGDNTVLKGALADQYSKEGLALTSTQRAAGLGQASPLNWISRLMRETSIDTDPNLSSSQRLIAKRQLEQQGSFSQGMANNALSTPGGIFADQSGLYTKFGQGLANNGADPIDYNRFMARGGQDNAAYGQMVYGLNYNPVVANNIQTQVANATLQYDPNSALQAQRSVMQLGGDARRGMGAFTSQVASFAAQYQAGLNPMAGSQFKTQYDIDYTQGAIYQAGEAKRGQGDLLGASQFEQNNAIASNLYSGWRNYGADANGAQYNRLQQLGSTQTVAQFQRTAAILSGDPLANSLYAASQGLTGQNAGQYLVQTGGRFGGTAGRAQGFDENAAAPGYAPIRAALSATNIAMGGDYLRPQDAGMSMQQLLGMNTQQMQSGIHTAQLNLTRFQFAQQDIQIANQRAMTTGVNLGAMQSQALAAGAGAMVDPNSGQTYASALQNGQGQWQLEDRGIALQRRQQDWGMQMQGQQLQLQQQRFAQQGQQFMENYNLNYNKTMTQEAWQGNQMQIDRSHQITQQGWNLQDLAYQRDRSQVSFGFSMIQSQEDIRYSTGRGRRDAMRHQDEAVIMHSMEMGQQDKQEQRAKQQIQWATEQFNLDKSHFQQTKQWTHEQMALDLRHFNESRTLEQKNMQLQVQDYEKQLQFIVEQRKNEDSLRGLQRAGFLISQKQQEDMQTQVEATTKKVNAFNDAMAVAATRLANATALLGVQGQTGGVPYQSGSAMNYPPSASGPTYGFSGSGTTYTPSGGTSAPPGSHPVTTNAGHVNIPNYREFAAGGYTGHGSVYEPAGIVHRGEYVIPQAGSPVVMSPELVSLQKEMLNELKAMHRDGGNVVFQVDTSNKNTAMKHGASLFNASWNH